MNSTHDDREGNSDAQIRQVAADWVAKRDAALTPAEQDAFFEWLAAAPRHAEVYAELQAVYREMDMMVEWRPLHALEPNPDLLASLRPRRFRRWLMPVVGGMAAALAVGLFWGTRPDPSGAIAGAPQMLSSDVVARSYERHLLSDGSIVELKGGAQVAARLEPTRRVLDLIAGEAHFTVAKDPRRPFVVRVGEVEVTAVGTQFNVAMISNRVEVFVTEGRIQVDPPARWQETARTRNDVPRPQTLDAGQGVIVAVDKPSEPWVVTEYAGEVMVQKLAWKDELLDFDAVPLAEVILEFNRRNHTQLVIEDEALGRRLITGSLRPENFEGFVELLELTQGVVAERQDGTRIVLRSRP
jgi:transmembrane sensor